MKYGPKQVDFYARSEHPPLRDVENLIKLERLETRTRRSCVLHSLLISCSMGTCSLNEW